MFRTGLVMAMALLVVGCGDDSTGDDPAMGVDAGGGTDAGEQMDTGTPEEDAGMSTPNLPDLPVLVNGDGADPTDPDGIAPGSPEAPNYECISMIAPPTGGEDIEFDIEIKEFRTDDTLEGLCVRYYADNTPMPGDECEASDPVTDADGRVTVTGPSDAWFAYRVFPKDGPRASLQIAGSVQINEPSPSEMGGSEEGNSVSQATLMLIPTVLGFRQEVGTAIVAGTAQDCDTDPVYGGVIRIFREDGTEISEGMRAEEPHFRYFDGDEFPSADMPWTHTDGLFAAANIPVASDGEFVFVELWGRLEEGGEPEVLGCDRIAIFADTISIVNMDPLRSEPANCPSLQ